MKVMHICIKLPTNQPCVPEVFLAFFKKSLNNISDLEHVYYRENYNFLMAHTLLEEINAA